MCHPTCATCTTGQNTFTDCLTCGTSRYLFANSCLCPKGDDDNSSYECEAFEDSVNNLNDFVYALQWGFLSLMLLSLFVKRNIPLTRKLIDISQTLGLLFYVHQYFEPRPTVVFQLFQMTNLSSLIPNYIANHFYGQSMDTSSSNTYTFLNMSPDSQTPSYKFLLNDKSSNFLMNQLQVMVAWAAGLIIFLLVGVGMNIIHQGKGFCEYIRFNIMNYVYIIFYFTFQESFLNIFLQLKNLQWTEVIHYCSLITLVLYLILAFIIIRSILVSQNEYPSDPIEKKIEMFRRRDQCHFLFAFEDPLTDITLQQKSEKSQLSPSEIIISNWIVLSLIQKAVMTAVIVFQYDNKVEISLIVIIIIFFKLFFLVRPIKNKLILVFCFLADCYVVVVIILLSQSYLVYLLWPGILCLNCFMIVEDVFSSKCYPTIEETTYVQRIKNHQIQNQVIDEKAYVREGQMNDQNQNILIQTGQTPQYTNKAIELKQNTIDMNNQVPLKYEQVPEQSFMNKQDTSMMQQTLIQNQSVNQEKLESLENINNQYELQKMNSKEITRSNMNVPLAPTQVKPKSKEMIDMKQKYLERIRKQNQVLLTKQPTQPELQKINSNKDQFLKKDNSIQLGETKQEMLQNNDKSQNQNKLIGKEFSEAELGEGSQNIYKAQQNGQERDTFFNSDEEEYDYYSESQHNKIDQQNNNMHPPNQYNQNKSNSHNLYNQNQPNPNANKSVKQQKIEEELSQNWNIQ